MNPIDWTVGKDIKLAEIIDRKALGEICESVHKLFGVSIRILSIEGQLLAGHVSEQPLCALVQKGHDGKLACSNTISAARGKALDGVQPIEHPCFTGAQYTVCSLEYDKRQVGKIIVGPFFPKPIEQTPQTLIDVDHSIDFSNVGDRLRLMPVVPAERAVAIAAHLEKALELILFSGHRALLTSQMHLASVTESYRQLEEQNTKLAESYDRLKELDRLKSNFLATVSHELRTPLTSILGYSEMLVEQIAGPMNDEQTEFVRTIMEKGEQLLSLIRSLLDSSKLESGTLTIHRAAINIADVINNVASTFLPVARKKGIELDCQIAEGLPKIFADAERLRQVFNNLTENAVKFTPEGGRIRLSASMETSQHDDEDDDIGMVLTAGRPTAILVSVADTGIGIPVGERSKIFDAFYQVDGSSTREYGGTGLGLSIVKRIVDLHEGWIAVYSNEAMSKEVMGNDAAPNRGSLFVVRLPVADGV
jgi:signal transduction histidine kinase